MLGWVGCEVLGLGLGGACLRVGCAFCCMACCGCSVCPICLYCVLVAYGCVLTYWLLCFVVVFCLVCRCRPVGCVMF